MKGEEVQKKDWQQMEILDSKLFHTTLQRGSGNQDHFPTDSINDLIGLETKHTTKNSFSLSREKWNKLAEEVVALNTKDNKLRIPVLSLHLSNLHLVVLTFEDYRKMADNSWKYESMFY